MRRSERRKQILHAFVKMLEECPGARITTAALSQQVGVSEAALYRHFPSKGKIIEALIESMEAGLSLGVINILDEETEVRSKCQKIVWLLLSFAERNPGFSRLFVGDALQGETDKLRHRIREFFDRIENQIHQVIEDGYSRHGEFTPVSPTAAANLMLSAAVGRINQFVRSEFKSLPTTDWEEQWAMLETAIFG